MPADTPAGAARRDLLALLHVDLGPGVRAAFTTRAGGASTGPYTSLNLGDHVADDPERVASNTQRVAHWLGATLTTASQVHGADVAVVGSDRPAERPQADVLVTTARGRGLGVMVADCVPVLLADASAGVVATAHAGRGGLVRGVVPNVVAAMVAHGASLSALRVAIGPSICGRCYEVPEQMREDVERAVPGTSGVTAWGTPSVDIAAGVARQLGDLGVTDVQRFDACTYEDERFYSYRRDGVTGRFAGVVALV